MKRYCCFLLSLFILMLDIPAFGQRIPLEIKDRKHLPPEIFAVLKNYRAILIGEVHGSNEAPQFMEGLVSLWLSSGEKVLLGLEINMDEQQRIDEFLRSGDFEVIKGMPFFSRESPDGRSSIAMAELIRACYKRENVKIVCLDATYATTGEVKRDSVMAANALAAMHANPGWKFISLTGNVHNKMESIGFGFPMGYWLMNIPGGLSRQEINSIDVIWESGNCWNCAPKCAVHEQGNYAYSLQGRTIYENCFFADEKKLFTRVASAAMPLNK